MAMLETLFRFLDWLNRLGFLYKVAPRLFHVLAWLDREIFSTPEQTDVK